jgi:cytosine/adenosine deaminase-related metal-dependent hydrolase
MTNSLLIQNGLILSGDGFDPVQGDLLIVDGRIAAVGSVADVPQGVERIDARNGIVAPGFVDTHRHVWQTQLRGAAANWSLLDYFVNMRMRYAISYQAEDAYLGNLLGALEAVDAGVTTVVDHCHVINSPDHADGALAGLVESGIRAVFAYGSFDNLSRDAAANAWRARDFERIADRLAARGDRRVQIGYAPAEAESLSFGQLVEETALARAKGAQVISCHVAMGGYDRGVRVVAKLAEAGVLGRDFLFVHGAALTDGELAAMAACGAGLSVTPETELQMGMGFPIAFKARAAGVRCGLGVDIVSNYAGDMAQPARLALQVERARRNEALAGSGQIPIVVTPSTADAYRLATLGGAEAIGMGDEIGSLAVGKAADLIIVRTEGLAIAPCPDPLATLLYYARPADIDTVIVNGDVRKRSGRLVHDDVSGPIDRLVASATAIRERAAQIDPAQVLAAVMAAAAASPPTGS